MKKRIRALKALILAAVMVVQLFGVDSLRALAESAVVNTKSDLSYSVGEGETIEITANGEVTASGRIYGSGGTVVNNGTIEYLGPVPVEDDDNLNASFRGCVVTNTGTIKNFNSTSYCDVTNTGTITTYNSQIGDNFNNKDIGTITTCNVTDSTITNTGTITTCNVTGSVAGSTVTNTGTIGDLTLGKWCTLNLNDGGKINTLKSASGVTPAPEVVVGGNATVSELSGSFDFSGTGTLCVTDVLNLTSTVNPDFAFKVEKDTKISVIASTENPVKIICGEKNYTLTETTSEKVLSDLVGCELTVEVQKGAGDVETMTQKNAFQSGKFLTGDSVEADYEAAKGYYFPTNYSASVTPATDGTATVSVNDDGKSIHVKLVFGSITTDKVKIYLPAATAKTTPAAPTGFVGGVKMVSNVPTDKELEYADSETATTWTPVTGLDDANTITMEPGTWYFRYKETNTMNASAATSVVVKDEGLAQINVSDVYYGTAPNPSATSSTNVGQTPTFEYKKATQEDTAYSATKPTAVGDYIVRATFPATAEYGEAVATAPFAIKYLEEPSPAYTLVGTEGQNGYYTSAVTVKPATGYTISTTIDGTYTEKLTVDASQAANTIYLKNSDGAMTDGIELEAISIDTSAPELNVEDGETYSVKTQALTITDDNGISKVTINGEAQTVSGTTFTTDLAESETAYEIVAVDEAGNSATATVTVLRATQAAPTGLEGGIEQVKGVSINMEYAASADAVTWTAVPGDLSTGTIAMEKGTWYFRYQETAVLQASAAVAVIVKGVGSGTVTMGDVYYGGEVAPQVQSDTNDVADVMIEYKEATQADTAYSATKPTAIGDYVVRATFPATEEYGEAVATATFAIKYLETPSPAYTLDGTAGQNGYYRSAVTVKPATGYTISKTLGGPYEAELTVAASQAAGTIYLKNSDGAMTDGIELEAISIDTSAPELNVEDRETYSVKTQALTVTDDNGINKVTINGVAQTVSGATFTTDLAESETAYVIVAEDIAGNSKTVTVTVLRAAQAAPTGLVGGVLSVSGVTDAMEYAASADAATWTAVTGISAENTISMTKGDWYFRYKETDDKNASPATLVTVKGEGLAEITINDVYYGTAPNPSATSSTNAGQTPAFEYKKATQADTAYSATEPTAIGDYVVRATFPATAEYGEAVATDTFAIKYLETPSPAYTLDGTAGQNGYYRSAVTVKPATGYTISKTLGGPYEAELTVAASQAAGTIYLKNSDGAMTDGIELEAISIDTSAPELNVEDGETYSVTTQALTVTDDNSISKVTINGVAQTVSGATFTTDLAESETAYVIVAEDIAGNSKTVTVTVLRAAQAVPTGLVGGVLSVSGVTDAMEYAASADAATWTAVTGISAANTISMTKGDWYFRYKETDDKKVSPATLVTVKGEGLAEIAMDDVYYGTAPNPTATSTTNSGQTPAFEYKKATQADTAYSATKPTAVGEYVVRATFPATAEYGEAVATKTFAIKYLETPSPAYKLDGTAGQNGYYTSSVTVKPTTGYTISTTLDGTYTETLTVDASQTAGTIYLKNSDGAKTAGIELEAINIDTSAPELNVEDGKTYSVKTQALTITDDNSISKVTINGVAQTVSGTTFTKNLAVSDTAYVIVAEDKAGNRTTATIRVEKPALKVPSGSIEVNDVYYGTLPKVKVISDSNNVSRAVIEYKVQGGSDATYTTVIPAKVGNYVVRATVPANDEYESVVVTSKFNIGYMPAPEKAYTLTGEKGNNGYYTSNVTVTPAQGYLVATKLDGTYQESLTFEDSVNASEIYLKKAATGEKTNAVSLEAIKIKKEVPTLNLEDGETYYGDTAKLVIRDTCLRQVYVNGVLQDFNGSEFVLELSSDSGQKQYEIKAVDDAGNTKTIVVKIAAEWMKTGLVPSGVKVNLEAGNGYKLGSGNWTVGGDATSYNGNTTFYVKQDGMYVFTNQ